MIGSYTISKEPIASLTSLRFVAAFLIFLFHFHIHVFPIFNIAIIDHCVARGAIGMSLFFILSGFLLEYNYGDMKYSDINEFYLKRFGRIYPAYIFWSLLFFYQLIPHFYSNTLFKTIGKAFLVIFADIFLLQAWFPHFFSMGTNGGTWSLSVEAFLYLLFPLLVLALKIHRIDNRKLIILILSAYVLTVIPPMAYFFFDQPLLTAYSLPAYRLGDFLGGMIICELYRRNTFHVDNKIFAIFGVLFLLIFGFSLKIFPHFTTLNFIVIPFFLVMILWAAQIKQYGNRFLLKVFENQFSQYLGKISYSFYLSQPFIFGVIRPFIEIHNTFLNKFYWLVIFLLINILCAAFSFEFIEKPFYRIILKLGIKKLSIYRQ
ncbi:MAG: acyltransferase [Alphaproteobacteria bacterium]|nr:acyltransferase [Alphaproteobacteria bacterium]